MITIPKQLQDEKYRFCMLGYHSKRPIEFGWGLDYVNWEQLQNKTWRNKATQEIYKIKKGKPEERLFVGSINSYKFNDPKLLNHIRQGLNYGCVGGWGGLWILDSDMALTDELIEKNFPKTFKVRKHYYFKCKDGQSLKIHRKENGSFVTYGDFQYWGKQCVGASSIHPSGETYKIINDVPIAEIKCQDVLNVFKDFIKDNRTDVETDVDGVIKIVKKEGKAPITALSTAILEKVTLKDVMIFYGFDVSKFNTKCLVHKSKSNTSFCWNNHTGLWNCWGCNMGGNAINLIRLMEGYYD